MKAIISPRFSTNRVLLKNVLPLKSPWTLTIHTGDICNSKCKYCVCSLPDDKLDKSEAFRSFLSWETFECFADSICELPDPVKVVTLSARAGEPLMNNNLPRMIRRLRDTGRVESVQLVTNGLLLTKEKSLELLDSGVDVFQISVNGTTSKMYKELCGVDINVEEFIENLRFLYDNKKQREIYIKILDICLEKPEDVGKEQFYEMYGNYCDRIIVANAQPVYREIDYTGIVTERKGSWREELWKGKVGGQHICYTVFHFMAVCADGRIVPCGPMVNPQLADDAVVLGNINDTSLLDAFCGKKRRDFLRMLLEKKRHEHPICGACHCPDATIFHKEDDLDPYAEELLPKFK